MIGENVSEKIGHGRPRRQKQNFGNDRSRHCGQFRVKIIENGAILTIVRPFEVFGKAHRKRTRELRSQGQ